MNKVTGYGQGATVLDLWHIANVMRDETAREHCVTLAVGTQGGLNRWNARTNVIVFDVATIEDLNAIIKAKIFA